MMTTCESLCLTTSRKNGTVMGSLIQIVRYRDCFLNALCDLMNSGLFDREHLETVINQADNAFRLIASYYYSPEDEAKRQQNVNLLRESACSRKRKSTDIYPDTFHPTAPYTLSVRAPKAALPSVSAPPASRHQTEILKVPILGITPPHPPRRETTQ